eukprot:SM000020S06066  [mRNA]  locus=s20:804740:808086:- [translate_table: standard]
MEMPRGDSPVPRMFPPLKQGGPPPNVAAVSPSQAHWGSPNQRRRMTVLARRAALASLGSAGTSAPQLATATPARRARHAPRAARSAALRLATPSWRTSRAPRAEASRRRRAGGSLYGSEAAASCSLRTLTHLLIGPADSVTPRSPSAGDPVTKTDPTLPSDASLTSDVLGPPCMLFTILVLLQVGLSLEMTSTNPKNCEDSASCQAQIDTLLFDLDDTLYPLSSGLAEACARNIQEYMIEHLSFSRHNVEEVSKQLYIKHGTTLAGLQALGYDLDYDHWHSFVHGRLPYEVLRPDPSLRTLLLSMKQRRLIFTNADHPHAMKVLRILGVEDLFEAIISFETLYNHNTEQITAAARLVTPGGTDVASTYKTADQQQQDRVKQEVLQHSEQSIPAESSSTVKIVCKPDAEAFRLALRLANATPHQTMFLDDSHRNIAAAKAAGIHTVLVGMSQKIEAADYAVPSIHNLQEAVPHLWDVSHETVSIDQSIVGSCEVCT